MNKTTEYDKAVRVTDRTKKITIIDQCGDVVAVIEVQLTGTTPEKTYSFTGRGVTRVLEDSETGLTNYAFNNFYSSSAIEDKVTA